MKGFGFCMWILVVFGAGVVVVSLSSSEGGIFTDTADVDFARYLSKVAPMARSRKLKETINLEDYHPIDPSPSSKASIRHGPIQHGTPLMPYIPKPSPPPANDEIP